MISCGILATPPGHFRIRIPNFYGKLRVQISKLQRATSHKLSCQLSHWISPWRKGCFISTRPLFGRNGLYVGELHLVISIRWKYEMYIAFYGAGCGYFFQPYWNTTSIIPTRRGQKKWPPPRGSQKIHRSATLRDAFLQRCHLAASVLGFPKNHHRKMLMSIQLKKM